MVITRLCADLKHNHVRRLSSGICGLEEGTVFTDILNSFTRIASHCASAMTALMKAEEADSDIHIHNSKVYAGEGMEYYSYYSEYSQKYDIGKNNGRVRSMEPEEIE